MPKPLGTNPNQSPLPAGPNRFPAVAPRYTAHGLRDDERAGNALLNRQSATVLRQVTL